MKLLRNISLILAGGLLLLHSFVPHQHHKTKEKVEVLQFHSLQSNLLGLLQMAFHTDLGSDHLESFETAGFTYVIAGGFDSDVLSKPSFVVIQSVFFSYNFTPFRSIADIQAIQFRGPPHAAASC